MGHRGFHRGEVDLRLDPGRLIVALHGFVLHLTRASARRDNAHALKDKVAALPGLDQTGIWPAVDGSAMSSTDLSEVVGAQLFEPSYPFPLKPGEIGCFLSHRQIWAEILRRGATAGLIVEDDAALDPALFAQAVGLAQANIAKLGYIQLQTRDAKGPAALIDTSGPCKLTVPEQGGLRTTAQMVSAEAAEHLLHLSEIIDRPVDTFVQSHWHTLLRPAAILPSGVSETPAPSTIQQGRKSLLQKLGREISRARYRRAVARLSRHSAAAVKGGFADV